jgi:hypothetical protein
MPDFDAINTALVARFSAAQVTAPAGGYDTIRTATGDLPGQMTPLPTVLVFPVSGTYDQKAAGKRDSTNMFTVRFYYNQTGDAERDFVALRKWLDVLSDQLRASVQLGGLTWSSGVRQGEVTRAKVDSWKIGTLTYANVQYSGIELEVSVLVNESLVMVA